MRYFIIIGLIIICACGKTVTETLPKVGDEYYPLTIGKYITYQLDSIIYDTLGNGANSVKVDTIRLFAKDVIKDTFRNLAGELSYRIERFERLHDSLPWSIKRVFSAKKTATYAGRSEDNLDFLKFPLPVFLNQEWDGNIFLDPFLKITVAGEKLEPFSKKWKFRAETIGKSETIGKKNFNEVLTLKGETDPKILTDWRYQLEKYAKGIGLVYREVKILDTQKFDPALTWEKKASKGFILKMAVIDYN